MFLKQEPAKRFILLMNNKQQLPSGFQIGQIVQVVFPGNAILKDCKIIKVAFPERGEPLYDVEVPFHHYDFDGELDPKAPVKNGFQRLYGLRQWFISYTQKDWDNMKNEANPNCHECNGIGWIFRINDKCPVCFP